ncbi:MAG TPA: hypothetical protein VJ770_30545 [Stellaceae bacterium]|nr:hypothetical protein [Stellaceae bacterium]
MRRWQISLVMIGLLAVPAWAVAQDYPSLHYPTMQYPTMRYPTAHYPTSPPPPKAAGQPSNPAASAATLQSGLSEAQLRTRLQSEGYSRLGDIQADSNSIWVWQADATKDGRRVRVGVDARGNVLVISPAAPRPCTTPGVNFGAGGLAAGARLSAASSCANP